MEPIKKPELLYKIDELIMFLHRYSGKEDMKKYHSHDIYDDIVSAIMELLRYKQILIVGAGNVQDIWLDTISVYKKLLERGFWYKRDLVLREQGKE